MSVRDDVTRYRRNRQDEIDSATVYEAMASAITSTAAGESIAVSREEFIASEIKPLAQELDAIDCDRDNGEALYEEGDRL